MPISPVPELVAELVITRAQLLAIEDAVAMGGAVDAQRYEMARKVYEQRYAQSIRAPVAPIDTGGGAAVANRPTPLWRR